MDEYAVLSGDLLFERKKISESLKRLSLVLSHPSISRQLSPQVQTGLQIEMDCLFHGVSRLNELARLLGKRAMQEGQKDCEPFLKDVYLKCEQISQALSRPIAIRPARTQIRIEENILRSFKPILMEMLETFLEFSIDGGKERTLREKPPIPNLRFVMLAHASGATLRILADGNGLIPPCSEEIGVKLARIGASAQFSGRSGKWSCWSIFLPNLSVNQSCVKFRINKTTIFLPQSAVIKISKINWNQLTKEEKGQFVSLNESYERSFERGHSFSNAFSVRVRSGTRSVEMLVDEVSAQNEVFMRTLPGDYTCGGRFLGVVVETGKSDQALQVVVNPAFLVYGDDLQSGSGRNSDT